mmetsp:Transcript_35900/g.82814  ORF Transcript_35900/g.82814 Transcript_35900/m.82814 type:complete len:211 (+) Transcript_35900:165-797(+)
MLLLASQALHGLLLLALPPPPQHLLDGDVTTELLAAALNGRDVHNLMILETVGTLDLVSSHRQGRRVTVDHPPRRDLQGDAPLGASLALRLLDLLVVRVVLSRRCLGRRSLCLQQGRRRIHLRQRHGRARESRFTWHSRKVLLVPFAAWQGGASLQHLLHLLEGLLQLLGTRRRAFRRAPPSGRLRWSQPGRTEAVEGQGRQSCAFHWPI